LHGDITPQIRCETCVGHHPLTGPTHFRPVIYMEIPYP
jgi:hypothetical protein